MSDLRNAVRALDQAREYLATAARRIGRVADQAEHRHGNADHIDVAGADHVPGGASRIVVTAPGIDRDELVRRAIAFGEQLGVHVGVYSAASGRNLRR